MYRKLRNKTIASILTLVLTLSAVGYFANEDHQYIKSANVQQINEYNPLSNTADARGKRKQGGEMKNKARKGKSNPRSNNTKKHTPSKKHKGGKKTKGSNKKKR